MNTPYGFGTTLQVPYEEAIPRVKEQRAGCLLNRGGNKDEHTRRLRK